VHQVVLSETDKQVFMHLTSVLLADLLLQIGEIFWKWSKGARTVLVLSCRGIFESRMQATGKYDYHSTNDGDCLSMSQGKGRYGLNFA